ASEQTLAATYLCEPLHSPISSLVVFCYQTINHPFHPSRMQPASAPHGHAASKHGVGSVTAGGTAMSIANRIVRASGRDAAPNYTVANQSYNTQRNCAAPQAPPTYRPALRCTIAGRTDRGLVRRNNQ